jgi:hypothetical protein
VGTGIVQEVCRDLDIEADHIQSTDVVMPSAAAAPSAVERRGTGRLITFGPPATDDRTSEDDENPDARARFGTDPPKRWRFSLVGN